MFKDGTFFCQYCKNTDDDLYLGVTDLTRLKESNNFPLPPFLMEINLHCHKCGEMTRFRVPLDRNKLNE